MNIPARLYIGLISLILPVQYAAADILPATPLSTVVVTASKYQKDIDNIPRSVSVITADDIEHSGARTIGELLNTVPGVNWSDYGSAGSISTVGIRGSTNAQVLILLNGQKLNNNLNGGFDLSSLPINLADIERIEIIRGESSALYSADAMGGVINIITKQYDEAHTQIQLSGGSFNTINGHISTSQNLNKNLNYSLSYTNENSGGYRPNSAYNGNIYNAGARYSFSPLQNLDIGAYHINKTIQVPGSLTFPTTNGSQNDKNTNIHVGYKDKTSLWLDLSTTYSLNDNNMHYSDIFGPSDHHNLTHITEIQTDMYLSDTNIVTTGLSYQSDSATSSSIGTHGYSTAGAFIANDVDYRGFSTSLGLRYDNNSVYGSQLSPQGGLVYHISNNLSLKTSAGYGYHAPSLNDLYWPVTPWVVGNPNLQPESSANVDAGITLHGDTQRLNITAYARKVNNLIQWVLVLPNASMMYYTPQNVQQADIYGIEADYTYRLDRDTYLNANYTYSLPKDAATNLLLSNIDIHKAVLGINFVPLWDINANVSGVYESRIVSSTAANSYATGDWLVVNAKISKDIGNSRIYLQINNLFNAKYENIPGYPAAPQSMEAGVNVEF